MDVMLDIETLGVKPGCVILSIGAVKFDEDVLGDEFHESISIESCMDAGLEIDADTLAWWLDQENQEVLTGGKPLAIVLNEFASFCDGSVWANSPAFDCVILRTAYEALDIKTPWEYYEEGCYRTINHLFDTDIEQEGVKHDALDDAKYQARVTSEVLSRL